VDYFYVTTPIYYINDVPHIGHSYTTIAADVFARYHRLSGLKVLFATGTDENAPKVVEAAKERGVSVREHVDEISEKYREMWAKLAISYDDFIRTTEDRHRVVVEDLVARMLAAGDIYKGKYEAWYCMTCETYFAQAEVGEEKLCPNAWCAKPLQWVSEENYFFRLTNYGDWLLGHIADHPNFLNPDFRRNEVVSFIKQGLRDVCISRKAQGWGIPVPGDPDQVIYVWFEALINYYTVAREWAKGNGWDPWPASLHLMAKDIFPRFHATLWPAMLHSLGLPIPEREFAHGFWTIDGQKFSKSLGNAIDPIALADELVKRSGTTREIAIDALRYFLMREIPFGADGDFSFSAMVRRYNHDLANDLGNLLNRSLSMAAKYFGGEFPAGTCADPKVAQELAAAHGRVTEALDRLAPHTALSELWSLCGFLNTYLDESAPWRRHSSGDTEGASRVLYTALKATEAVAGMLLPFMPRAAGELLRQLGVDSTDGLAWEDFAWIEPAAQTWKVREPVPVFPRIERDMVPKEGERFSGPQKAGKPVQEERKMETISFKDFQKVDLRVGVITAAERVEGADKLLKIEVDIGTEKRSGVAGLAPQYSPEDLVGKKIAYVANLEPATIRGIESAGMLLAAVSDDKSQVVILTPESDIAPGSKIS
jgi:methionyl-tRNA synthetase